MSAYSTCSPSSSHTLRYRTRPPSVACTWRNLMSWLWVAVYRLTGTFTRPNDTDPFHIARIAVLLGDCCKTGVMSSLDVDGHRVKVSNLDKVLYPDDGTTKYDILQHYF